MSKKSQPQTGKEKLAVMQAEQARKSRQTKLLAILSGFVVVVLAVVAIGWAVANQNKKEADQKAAKQAKERAFIPQLAKIPDSTFAKVGAGDVSNPPKATSALKVDTKDGKPVITYVGAEFCPFCAMERWSLVIALERFGDFSGLDPALSSPKEQIANIPTVTFKDSTYKSKYVEFESYETADRAGKPLQQPPQEVNSEMSKVNPRGSIPWINYGGKFTSNGSSYLGHSMANMSSSEVMKQLQDPDSKLAKQIIGSANAITSTICTLTDGKPANVCEAKGVVAAGAKGK